VVPPSVIGLDTNVLLRLLVDDDAQQSAIARDFAAQTLSSEAPGYVSVVVLAELCWVLRQAHGFAPAEIATFVRQLLEATELVVDQSGTVRTALDQYATGPTDFVDALIAALGAAAGCAETVTFDRRFARQPGVRLLR
jgi:predicted nucleic-acid-binding protein